MSFNIHQETFTIGELTVTLETGKIARQAQGSVILKCGKTTLLATTAIKKCTDPMMDFFPLTVNYIEKYYAAGVPGGFFKRETKPSEREVLISRLIDRSLRPLFPSSYHDEVQVIITTLSLDPNINPDTLALIAASASVRLSGAPIEKTVTGVRVGMKDSSFVINPSQTLECPKLDLVVSGTQDAVLMAESEAKFLDEQLMIDAIYHGHTEMQSSINAIDALTSKAGKAVYWKEPEAVSLPNLDQYSSDFDNAFSITEKHLNAERHQLTNKT